MQVVIEMAERIFVVDDEAKIRSVMKAYLEREGYEVEEEGNGRQALERIREGGFDMVILDLMLPEMSGEMVCAETRKFTDMPILMLTAKKEEMSRLQGLSLGADDYVVKPFSPKEIVLRVQAILRRSRKMQEAARETVFSYNDGYLLLDDLEKMVKVAGEEASLTGNEYDILNVMAKNPDRTFSREDIIELAFGYDYEGYDRTVDTYIKTLRKKIEPDPKKPELIVTVYGMGYKFKGRKDRQA